MDKDEIIKIIREEFERLNAPQTGEVLRRGGLPFPIDEYSKLSLKSSFMALGTATLVAGTATVNDTRIRGNSIAFLTFKTAGGTQGFLRATIADGSLTITSSSGTDTSDVYYLIIF